MVQIEESGLRFGEFQDSDFFEIEKSEFVLKNEGMKSCEFVWHDNKKQLLWFLEAKSSVPHPQNSRAKYDDYFQEIFEKLENSVISFAMGKLGKLAQVNEELSQSLLELDWSKIGFKLVLVIPTAPVTTLPPLSEKLRSLFTRQVKLWGCSILDIAVLNEEYAQRAGLLID